MEAVLAQAIRAHARVVEDADGRRMLAFTFVAVLRVVSQVINFGGYDAASLNLAANIRGGAISKAHPGR